MATAPTALPATQEIEPIPRGPEHYGLSLSAMRNAGRVALLGANTAEYEGALKQLRGEFDSCLFEGLSSDEEYGEGMRVAKFDVLPIVDGRVMSADYETPVVELVQNGLEASSAAALDDSRMQTQVIRDENDYRNAREVDAMVAGERDYNTRLVISSDPSEAIERDGEKYWRNVGYIKDVIYIQLYHRSADDVLVTGSLSFRASDKVGLRASLAKFGIIVPEGESVDNYINYPLTATMEEEDAGALALDIGRHCEQGNKSGVNTVTVLQENQAVIDAVFDEMYVPIAESLAIEKQTLKTKNMTASFLARSSNFSQGVRGRLAALNNKVSFDEDDARLLHQLTVYSAIEKLRDSLRVNTATGTVGIHVSEISHYHQPGMLLAELARMADIGAEAGRSYSSCGASIRLADGENGINSGLEGIPQEVYGGKTCRKEVKDGDLVKCPHCDKAVKAIVKDTNDKKIQCSNKDCKEAAESVKEKH